MSGPKVVRIVTREEIEAICRRHIANAEEAAAELRRCAKRHDALTDALITDLDGRFQQLRRLFEEDRWTELQKQAPLTVTFLKTEMQQIRVSAIAAAEVARSKGRRIADAARTIISAMEASGHEAPSALRNVAMRANLVNERELLAMEAVLTQSYATHAARRNSVNTSKEQRELAGRLGADEQPQSFPEWLAAQSSNVDQRDRRLDALMAEIETLEDAEIVQPFKERAAAIVAEASPERRALLTDSLVLDLSEWSRRRRTDEIRAERLREVLASLQTFARPATHAMEIQVTSMLQSARLEAADDLVARARAVIESETTKLAAAARRRAVLEGLAELGYEVRESMATAWARDGRLVVRKPDATDYGVEFGAPPDMSRLQVRLVGSNRPVSLRNAQRDRDMETIWCSEVGRLQQLLRSRGGDFVIERALDAGVEPVKTVTFIDSERETRAGQRQMTRRG
jgi:hypothetical protein